MYISPSRPECCLALLGLRDLPTPAWPWSLTPSACGCLTTGTPSTATGPSWYYPARLPDRRLYRMFNCAVQAAHFADILPASPPPDLCSPGITAAPVTSALLVSTLAIQYDQSEPKMHDLGISCRHKRVRCTYFISQDLTFWHAVTDGKKWRFTVSSQCSSVVVLSILATLARTSFIGLDSDSNVIIKSGNQNVSIFAKSVSFNGLDILVLLRDSVFVLSATCWFL